MNWLKLCTCCSKNLKTIKCTHLLIKVVEIFLVFFMYLHLLLHNISMGSDPLSAGTFAFSAIPLQHRRELYENKMRSYAEDDTRRKLAQFHPHEYA